MKLEMKKKNEDLKVQIWIDSNFGTNSKQKLIRFR